MSKAEEQALKAYPECMVYNDLAMEYEDINGCYRIGFEVGYNQAEQDLMEKFKMWVAHNGYTAKAAEAVYNDFKQFIGEN
jgi:hypothetical protein